jgi:hypothetical protein
MGKRKGKWPAVYFIPQARWWPLQAALYSKLADMDVDQVRLDRGDAMAGLFHEEGKFKSILTCHSLFHVRDGSIDELLFDSQIAETRPQKVDVIKQGTINPRLVRVSETMVSLINANPPGLTLPKWSRCRKTPAHIGWVLLELMEGFWLEWLSGKRGCSQAQANTASLARELHFRSKRTRTGTCVLRNNANALHDELRALFFMQSCFPSTYVCRSRTICLKRSPKNVCPKSNNSVLQ